MILSSIKENRQENRIRQFQQESKEYTKDHQFQDEQWQPGADDFVGVYSFVFLRSNVRNHHAQFHYVNDWRHDETNSQPVAHLLTFYEGFLEFVSDLDPNLKTEEGEFISTHTIAKSVERAIVNTSEKYKAIPVSWRWVPALLSHIGLEIGALRLTSVKVHDGEVTPVSCTMTIPNDFIRGITDHFEIAQEALSLAKDNLGFEMKLGEPILVEFSRTYPSHVYTDLGLQLSRFVRFELDE
jgi:hypothetical protein